MANKHQSAEIKSFSERINVQLSESSFSINCVTAWMLRDGWECACPYPQGGISSCFSCPFQSQDAYCLDSGLCLGTGSCWQDQDGQHVPHGLRGSAS